MVDLDAKRSDLRRRAEQLRERGVDVTQWLEHELGKAQAELELAAIDVELTTRERESGKLSNARWIAKIFWVFAIVVILVHFLNR
jgi:hypothetical protein